LLYKTRKGTPNAGDLLSRAGSGATAQLLTSYCQICTRTRCRGRYHQQPVGPTISG
jgi:hypothetical protein